MTNWLSRPPVISPLTTEAAPYHSTAAMLITTSRMTSPVSPERDSMRSRAATNERSTARWNCADDRAFVDERLHGAHGGEVLGRIGRSLRKRILRRPRQAPHHAAIADERQHDQRNGDEHQQRQASGS